MQIPMNSVVFLTVDQILIVCPRVVPIFEGVSARFSICEVSSSWQND